MQPSLRHYTERASQDKQMTLDEFLSDSHSLEQTFALMRDALTLRTRKDALEVLGYSIPRSLEIETAELMAREKALFKNLARRP